jgi:thiamine biosynthesis lipoprotein ApbE
MTKAWKHYIPVVITVLVALSLVGCANMKKSPVEKMQDAFTDARTKVLSAVADPERAAQANALLVQLEQNFADTRETTRSHKNKLAALNQNYDATRADMAEQMELILAAVAANQQRVLHIRTQLLALLTPAEWDDIDKARSKALKAAAKALEVS